MKDMRIFVATHKVPEGAGFGAPYEPLLVGAARFKGPIPEGLLRDDDVAGSISWKNPYYCELTGLYWAWKASDAPVKGLAHYRRYLASPQTPEGEAPSAPLSADEIESLLATHGALVAKREYYSRDLLNHFYYCHQLVDLQALRKEMAVSAPEYVEVFDRLLLTNSMHPYNMLIASRELFDEYCAWLFPLLERCECRVNPFVGHPAYQTRIFGFLSERLLNVFLEAKNIDIVECPVYSDDAAVVKEAIRANQPAEPESCFLLLQRLIAPPEDSTSLDIDWYIEVNEDLRTTFKGDYGPFISHYYHAGLEGLRRGSREFDITDYMNLRPDLRMIYKDDYNAYVRDFDELLKQDPCPLDLPISTNRTLGVTVLDGVDYEAVYDYAYYIDRYPDAPTDFYDSEITLRHFVEVGMPEGRRGSARFDAMAYKELVGPRDEKSTGYAGYYLEYMKKYQRKKFWRSLLPGKNKHSYLSDDIYCPDKRRK